MSIFLAECFAVLQNRHAHMRTCCVKVVYNYYAITISQSADQLTSSDEVEQECVALVRDVIVMGRYNYLNIFIKRCSECIHASTHSIAEIL